MCVCIVQGFGSGLAVIPFMGLLESIAIAKAFGKCFIHTHSIALESLLIRQSIILVQTKISPQISDGL